MWLIAEYEAATLFSLKPRHATSSGGKSLLIPTPFAVKMALLDAACRTLGLEQAQQRWPEIRSLGVALRPAANAVVSNSFHRVWTPWEFKGKAPDKAKSLADALAEGRYPFKSNIGYREYVHLNGSFALALRWEGDSPSEWLRDLMIQINYLGKRGCFMQLLDVPVFTHALPDDFVALSERTVTFPFNGTLQLLDDCQQNLTFKKVNIYDAARMRDSDRLNVHVVLPYRLKRSSKSFTWYEAFATQ